MHGVCLCVVNFEIQEAKNTTDKQLANVKRYTGILLGISFIFIFLSCLSVVRGGNHHKLCI